MSATSDDRPRIAVVGAGWWSSSFHLPALANSDRASLAAVVDVDQQRRTSATERYGVAGYTSLAELGEHEQVDGVLVTVPHEAHHSVTSEALAAGFHVFLEKPMTLTARDAWDLVERARQADRHLALGYTHQYTRLADRLLQAIAGGELGELVHIAALSATVMEPLLRGAPAEFMPAGDLPPVPPSAETYSQPGSGGQALSQLTHATGFVCHVSGLAPREVAAFMNNHGLAVDLTDAVSVQFDTGATATLSSTGSIRPGRSEQQELRFYGTEATALVDLLAGTLRLEGDGWLETLELSPEEICPPLEPAQRFADLLAGRADNPAPGKPAAHAVEIIEAAHRSVRERRSIPVATLLEHP